MATPTQKIPVELGGKTRHFRFAFLAMAAIEDATQQLPEQVIMRAQAGSPNAMATVVWAGLLHEDKAITIDDVKEWLDVVDMNELTAAVVKAQNIANGDGDSVESEGNAEAIG
jgi:hypothetical protein